MLFGPLFLCLLFLKQSFYKKEGIKKQGKLYPERTPPPWQYIRPAALPPGRAFFLAGLARRHKKRASVFASSV
jgi:hypothetical protein